MKYPLVTLLTSLPILLCADAVLAQTFAGGQDRSVSAGRVTQDGIPPLPGTPLPGTQPAPSPAGRSGIPPVSVASAQSTPNGTAPANNPAQLAEPIDPLTGIPLRLTSLWPRDGEQLKPLPPPMVEAPVPSPIPHARIKAAPGHYPVRPLDRVPPSDLLPTPDLPHLPGIPGPSYSGPTIFEGNVDGLIEAPELGRDPHALPLDTPPNPEIDFPQDTLLDPSLFDSGNNDGQLDWIDLIEEYAGRMTRGDIPDEPHNTPKEDRSWLRIEHWRADASWLAGSGDDIGWLTGYGDVVIGLPKIRGLTVKPSFAFHNLRGPRQTDLPSSLYDLQAEVAWMRRFDARWRLRLAGTGGFYSDSIAFKDGLRFSGQSLVTYECNPDLQIVGGASIVNLANRRILPVGGIVWYPNDRHRFELIYPEWKVAFVAQQTLLWTKWAYVTGGFWGRTWEIRRSTGAVDDVTYSDWRVAVGMEKKAESDIYSFIEVGVAFSREVDYESDVGDYDPGTVGFVRGGFHF